jgi:sensor histidine kinase regulating citrate/malate metabolism
MRQVAEKKGVTINIKGESYKQPPTYNSFELIPLVLIDNAIKYSLKGQRIEVVVQDLNKSVKIEVISFSPLIPIDERDLIFERNFRGKNSSVIASRGSGLGLYLAKIVAEAHGFTVSVKCDENPRFVEWIEYCNNTFWFEVPI